MNRAKLQARDLPRTISPSPPPSVVLLRGRGQGSVVLTQIFAYFFSGLEYVGLCFDYVAHCVFLKDVWIRTLRAAIGRWRATNPYLYMYMRPSPWLAQQPPIYLVLTQSRLNSYTVVSECQLGATYCTQKTLNSGSSDKTAELQCKYFFILFISVPRKGSLKSLFLNALQQLYVSLIRVFLLFLLRILARRTLHKGSTP